LHALDWAVILGTAAVGAALGAVRAHLVRLRRHPDTGAIEATLSAWGLIIILAWIAGRMLLKNSGWVDVNAQFGLYNEASMALALALVVAQAVVLTHRCQAVRAEYKPIIRQPPGKHRLIFRRLNAFQTVWRAAAGGRPLQHFTGRRR
jgi:hypothetical protein